MLALNLEIILENSQTALKKESLIFCILTNLVNETNAMHAAALSTSKHRKYKKDNMKLSNIVISLLAYMLIIVLLTNEKQNRHNKRDSNQTPR